MNQPVEPQSNEQVLFDAFNLLCRHIVSLNWYEGPVNAAGEFIERPEFGGVSGFLLESDDTWYLATVGHVFSEIGNRKKSDSRRIVFQPSILDYWGAAAIHTGRDGRIPFDFLDAHRFAVDNLEDGLDFALIKLTDLYRDLLRKNGRLSFQKKDWLPTNIHELSFFVMAGFAEEDTRRVVSKGRVDEEISNEPAPSVVHVEYVSDDDVPSKLKRSNPRFFAKINPRADIESVRGMSGGPIFGFGTDSIGQNRYWPVAMQSGWLQSDRIIAASPLFLYADDIDRFCDPS